MDAGSTPSTVAATVNRWAAYALGAVFLYLLSSGPIIAAACWLREWTHNDAFYQVFWLYYPLFALGHDNPIVWYIEFWVVDVFDTVGPG